MKWAIVEVFGHQKHAGVTEDVEVLGTKMCVVTQPSFVRHKTETDWYTDEEDDHRRRSRKVIESYPETRIELGAGAIFRRTWVDEQTARQVLPYVSWGDVTPHIEEGPWEDPLAKTYLLAGEVSDAEIPLEPQPEDCGREMVPDEQDVPSDDLPAEGH